MRKRRRMDPAQLEVFRYALTAVAEEMGAVLGRSAYSVNIRERKDYSCAIFNADGDMLAQAAHIPVHLGAMPLSVQWALRELPPMAPGDVILLNDPYRGGTHLPDVTILMPVWVDDELRFFTANRAHHADIGGMSPGSMPLASEIFQEGLIIPPVFLYRQGRMVEEVRRLFLANVRTPGEREGDLMAQVAACRVGARRLEELCRRYGSVTVLELGAALMDYSERLMAEALKDLPEGRWEFEDVLDDDGIDPEPVVIRAAVAWNGHVVDVDFTGSSPQRRGAVNAVYAVTLSAVRYCFRCLLNEEAPTNDGLFRRIRVTAPEGSVVHAVHPAAVSSGNVETSQRIVDVVFGALAQALPDRIPAASAGTMSNFTFGGTVNGTPFTFYETIAGGAGGGPHGPGESAVQTHMTNTMNTPVEALEMRVPVRIRRYRIRTGSGGAGRHRGGDGILREFEFLVPCRVGLTADRHRRGPYGLQGGAPGNPGRPSG